MRLFGLTTEGGQRVTAVGSRTDEPHRGSVQLPCLSLVHRPGDTSVSSGLVFEAKGAVALPVVAGGVREGLEGHALFCRGRSLSVHLHCLSSKGDYVR